MRKIVNTVDAAAPKTNVIASPPNTGSGRRMRLPRMIASVVRRIGRRRTAPASTTASLSGSPALVMVHRTEPDLSRARLIATGAVDVAELARRAVRAAGADDPVVPRALPANFAQPPLGDTP